MPYVRAKVYLDYKSEETKFTFECDAKSTKTITKQMEGKTQTIVEVTKEMQTKKVVLKTWGHTGQEDCEHFFEAFEKLQTELQGEWEAARQAKTRDARILFKAFDQLVTGNANSEWHDTMANETKRDWETFKTLVAQFICTVVLSDDAYNWQVQYMLDFTKPLSLTSMQWWLRIETLNHYLRYFFKSLNAYKLEFPKGDFTQWWTQGGLSNADLKRIVMTKIPMSWQMELRKQDLGHSFRDTKTTEDLIDYFTTLENLEQIGRQRGLRPASEKPAGKRYNMPRVYRYNAYGSRTPQERAPGRQPGREIPYQYGSQIRGQVHTMMQKQSQQPGYMYNRGGRAGRSGRGRYNPWFGGQRTGRGTFQHNQQYQPRGEAHLQEMDTDTEQQKEGVEEETVDSQEEMEQFTMEEMVDAWNESLYLEPPLEDDDDEGYDYDDSESYYGETSYGEEDQYG